VVADVWAAGAATIVVEAVIAAVEARIK